MKAGRDNRRRKGYVVSAFDSEWGALFNLGGGGSFVPLSTPDACPSVAAIENDETCLKYVEGCKNPKVPDVFLKADRNVGHKKSVLFDASN